MPKHNDLEVYPFDPSLDPRDGLFGFDFNTGGKSKNFKLEYLRYFILQGLDNSNNGFILNNGFVLTDNVLTINAGWQWVLNGLLCTNEEDIVITLEYAANGFLRIDSIYANSNGEFLLVSGTETETIAIPPSIPINTLSAFSINIFDTSIDPGNDPVIGNIYLKKIFDKIQNFTSSGSNVLIPFSLYGYNTITLNGSMTSISGFTFSDLDNNPTIAEYPHEGKLILLINVSGHDITLKNTDFSSEPTSYFNFSSELDLIIPNKGKLIVKNTENGLIDIFRSWIDVDSYQLLIGNLPTEDDISDSDKFNYLDSSDGNKPKKTTWLNIRAKLTTVFNALFVPKNRTLTIGTETFDLSENRTFTGGGGDSYFTIEMSMAIGNFTQVSYDRIPLRDNTTDPFPMGEYFDPVSNEGDFRCAAKIIPTNSELKAVFFRANNLSNQIRLRVLAFDAMNGSISNVTTLALKTLPPITGVKVFKYDLSEILNTSIQPEGRLITLAFFTPTGPVSFQSNRVTCLFKKV